MGLPPPVTSATRGDDDVAVGPGDSLFFLVPSPALLLIWSGNESSQEMGETDERVFDHRVTGIGDLTDDQA